MSGSMSGRAKGSTLRMWILLQANRWVLAGSALIVFFGALVAGNEFGFAPIRELINDYTRIGWIFSSFISSIITGVTLVVTLNQLVLSQELGAIGDQRERMQESMDFRKDIEEMADATISPPEPAAFLQSLLQVTKDRADSLEGTIEDERDEELKEKVSEYAENVTNDADSVTDSLDTAQFGTYDVLGAVLNFNYSWKIFSARRIRNQHDDSLSEGAEEAFDDMVEALQFFAPAREHFKTLYFQWELVNVSRALLYISIPALIVTGWMLMYVGPASMPGTTLGIDNMVWVTSAAFTAGTAPFIVLLSYILRIGTVAKRTLAMGPFILRETEREGDIDWS